VSHGIIVRFRFNRWIGFSAKFRVKRFTRKIVESCDRRAVSYDCTIRVAVRLWDRAIVQSCDRAFGGAVCYGRPTRKQRTVRTVDFRVDDDCLCNHVYRPTSPASGRQPVPDHPYSLVQDPRGPAPFRTVRAVYRDIFRTVCQQSARLRRGRRSSGGTK
jgi:hypothetical protein